MPQGRVESLHVEDVAQAKPRGKRNRACPGSMLQTENAHRRCAVKAATYIAIMQTFSCRYSTAHLRCALRGLIIITPGTRCALTPGFRLRHVFDVEVLRHPRNGGGLLDGDLAGRVVDADEVDAGGDAGGDCRGRVEARHADADGVVYAHLGGDVASDGYLAGGGLHCHDA